MYFSKRVITHHSIVRVVVIIEWIGFNILTVHLIWVSTPLFPRLSRDRTLVFSIILSYWSLVPIIEHLHLWDQYWPRSFSLFTHLNQSQARSVPVSKTRPFLLNAFLDLCNLHQFSHNPLSSCSRNNIKYRCMIHHTHMNISLLPIS